MSIRYLAAFLIFVLRPAYGANEVNWSMFRDAYGTCLNKQGIPFNPPASGEGTLARNPYAPPTAQHEADTLGTQVIRETPRILLTTVPKFPPSFSHAELREIMGYLARPWVRDYENSRHHMPPVAEVYKQAGFYSSPSHLERNIESAIELLTDYVRNSPRTDNPVELAIRAEASKSLIDYAMNAKSFTKSTGEDLLFGLLEVSRMSPTPDLGKAVDRLVIHQNEPPPPYFFDYLARALENPPTHASHPSFTTMKFIGEALMMDLRNPPRDYRPEKYRAWIRDKRLELKLTSEYMAEMEKMSRSANDKARYGDAARKYRAFLDSSEG